MGLGSLTPTGLTLSRHRPDPWASESETAGMGYDKIPFSPLLLVLQESLRSGNICFGGARGSWRRDAGNRTQVHGLISSSVGPSGPCALRQVSLLWVVENNKDSVVLMYLLPLARHGFSSGNARQTRQTEGPDHMESYCTNRISEQGGGTP